MDINLTPREHMIMKILWDNGKPMTVTEINPLVKSTSSHTVHALLNSLMDKGLIKVVGSIKLVKVPCRLYEPKVSVTEFAMLKSDEVFVRNNKKFATYDFMTCLIKKKKNDKDDIIAELESFIQDYKNSSTDDTDDVDD